MNAIYARQSVEKKDSLSIESQVELCRRFAGEDALVFEDRGFSGKNVNRPAFSRLLLAVEEGQVGKLFVYRLDRFSRSIADFSRLWELLERRGVEFLSATEQFDTSSPMGRAMLHIVLVFAQLERETTAARVRDNYLHRFALGQWPGGPAPYGFRLSKCREGGRRVSTLTPDDRADTVRAIFRRYAQPEVSLRALARSLTDGGVPGPRQGPWDSAGLSRLLRSPAYVRADEDVYWHYLAQGLTAQQGPEAFDGVHACAVLGRRSGGGSTVSVSNHEGLVDAPLWLAVQEKLRQNRQLGRSSAGAHSWLTGLLKCAGCGYAVRISRDGRSGRFYLSCSGRSNRAVCSRTIPLDLRALEDAVADEITALLAQCPPDEPAFDAGADAALLALDERIARLLAALSESRAVSAAYISGEIDRLHQQRRAVLERAAPAPRAAPLSFAALCRDEKRLVAGVLIDRILLDGEQVNILWKL